MGTRFRFLNETEECHRLTRWWQSLDGNRGDRARLRRAEGPEDVLLTEAFFRFLQRMPDKWATTDRLLSSALVAAALSHVKNPQDGQAFATQLAIPKRGSTPRVSELRFQQLQKSRNPDEFFRRLIRVIHLVECNVNILSLADSILHWMEEYRYGVDRESQKRLAVCWATDFYKEVMRNNP